MTQVFRLPDLGEGLTEATVVQWHVAEGDHVVIDHRQGAERCEVVPQPPRDVSREGARRIDVVGCHGRGGDGSGWHSLNALASKPIFQPQTTVPRVET